MKHFKHFLLIILLILFNTMANAQDYQTDNNYKSLQNNIRNLEKALERNDMAGMERYLKYCNKFIDKLENTYAGIDLSAEKSKIQGANTKVNASKAEKDKIGAQVKVITDWKYPMEQLYLLSFNQQDTEKLWEKFQTFDPKELILQINNLPTSEQKGYVLEVKKLIENHNQLIQSYGTITRFDQSLQMIKGRQDEAEIRPLLRRLEVAAKGLLKITPNHLELHAKLEEIHNLQDNIHLILDNHKAVDRRKNADKIPTALQNNASIEAGMVEAIKFQNFPGVTILKAILTDANWVDELNELGVKIGRRMEAVIVMKNDQGECFFQYFDFRQPKSGSGYGKIIRKASGERYYIDCNKI